MAALTFDDGPSEWTQPILEELDRHHAKATFFILGSHIDGNMDVLRRTISDGHELGIHGWDHRRCDKLTRRQIEEQLSSTAAQILIAGQEQVRWWRPPWHKVTKRAAVAAEKLDLHYCGITVDGFDVNRGTSRIVDLVAREMTAGAIIGLHDGIAPNGNQETPHRRHTVRAVRTLLEMFAGEYRFVTVSDLLA